VSPEWTGIARVIRSAILLLLLMVAAVTVAERALRPHRLGHDLKPQRVAEMVALPRTVSPS